MNVWARSIQGPLSSSYCIYTQKTHIGCQIVRWPIVVYDSAARQFKSNFDRELN